MSRMPLEGPRQGEIVNLTDRRAGPSRRGQIELLASKGPDGILHELSQLEPGHATPRAQPEQPLLPHLVMPAHHDVRAGDVNLRRLHATLAAAADAGRRILANSC